MNLFVIMTPLQLINAVEAKYYFKIPQHESVLLIIYPNNRLNQIKYIIDENDWNKIYWIEREEEPLLSQNKVKAHLLWAKNCWNFNRLSKTLKKKFPELNQLFLGNYIYEQNLHLGNFLTSKNIFLLDDGNASIDIANFRNQDKSFYRTERFGIKSKIRVLIKKTFFNYKIKSLGDLTYFSSYQLNVGFNDKYIHNDYKFLKSKLRLKSQTKDVFFLGGSLVENNIISFESFTILMKHIKAHFGDQPLIYIKHPGENYSKVDDFLISNNISIKKYSVPIEIALLKEKNLPLIISGFFSSALFNLKNIYNNKLEYEIFRINKSLINPSRQIWADRIYKQLGQIPDFKCHEIE